MTRSCSVCAHPQRFAIEKSLVDGTPYRDIAGQFDLSRSALERHRNGHLPAALADAATGTGAPTDGADAGQRGDKRDDSGAIRSYVLERAARDRSERISVFAELHDLFERVKLLFDACDEWLRDPDDPSRYTLEPRAEEITVVYREPAAIVDGVQTYGPRRKASLAQLLGRLDPAAYAVDRSTVKTGDPRELLLKTAGQLEGQTRLLAGVLERLHNAEEVRKFEEAVLAAIGEVAPEVRDQIVEGIARQRDRALALEGRER